MKNLYICGLDEVPLFADKEINYIFSIGGKEEKLPYIHMFDSLSALYRFSFYDLSDDHPSFQKHIDNGFNPPTLEDVNNIFDKYRGIEKGKSNILIHCKAGISRSTAVAFILYYYHLRFFCRARSLLSAKEAAWNKIMQIRPIAEPNILIIKYADKYLNEKGKLTRFAANKLNITNYAY